MRGIGTVRGEFFVYDRDSRVLGLLDHQQALTRYLNEYGGVRVYRDGVRVYNYGEQGDDWLGLDLRRVNSPSRSISNNIIIGAVHLTLEGSEDLVEKTNREGFVENDAFARLQKMVLGLIDIFETERFIDKNRIRLAGDPKGGILSVGMDNLIEDANRRLNQLNIADPAIMRDLERIRRHHNEMQETLLSAGISGLSLAIVFHEIERGVRTLHHSIVRGLDTDKLLQQARGLAETLDGFSTLLRRNTKNDHSANSLIRAALHINALRLEYHGIEVACPLIDNGEDGFRSKFAFNMMLGVLSNLIDNSIYWTSIRHPDSADSHSTRRLYIDVTFDIDDRPAIVLADNGTGFAIDSMEHVTRPFFTHKRDGMGLGLFYAKLALGLQNGALEFPESGEISLPDGLDGAVVAMVFAKDE